MVNEFFIGMPHYKTVQCTLVSENRWLAWPT